MDPEAQKRGGARRWCGSRSSRSSSTGSTRSSPSTRSPATTWRTSSSCCCARLESRLAARRISLEVSPDARAWLADAGYDPAYGARPLRRLIQTSIGDPLARLLIAGDVTDGGSVKVERGEDGLVLAG